jgi:Glycosyl hydrolases family 43
MVGTAVRTGTVSRRPAVTTVCSAAVVAVVLGLAAVFGVGAIGAGARSANESEVSPIDYLSTGALGAAAGETALGLQTPYFDPPALGDPATPGFTINSGADQPDPFMIQVGGRYYLFTSQDKVPQNVPVRSGTVVGRWGAPTDALPTLPPWAAPGFMWAPDVAQFGSDYMLYFTSQLAGVSPPTMCIGDAISTAIAGPYLAAPAPLICQQSLGGSIDPRVFVDADGQPYMVWKSDQNARSDTANTQIYSQPLSADGMHLLGQPTVIFGPDEHWQGHIVEAPELVLVRGSYYLFYSGGWFNQPAYSIGAARCSGPLGPCADTSASPLLGSNAQGQGPGEESVFSNDAGVWLLYTPFNSTLPLPGPPRPVAMAHLGFGPNGPYLAAPLEVGTSPSTTSSSG